MMGTQPIETAPPCVCHVSDHSETTSPQATYDVVVLAADGARLARGRADADRGERRALEADLASHVAQPEAERRQDRGARGGIRLRARACVSHPTQTTWIKGEGGAHLLEAVAALDGAGVAALGGSKEWEREGEGGDAGEHLWFGRVRRGGGNKGYGGLVGE